MQGDYDTFGVQARQAAVAQAGAESLSRPSAIPGPVPEELVVAASYSIGECIDLQPLPLLHNQHLTVSAKRPYLDAPDAILVNLGLFTDQDRYFAWLAPTRSTLDNNTPLL